MIRCRDGRNGFTLVELMVTLAVGIVLVLIGIPSYTAMVQRNALASELNAFSAQLQLARAEALKRNATVILCPGAIGGECKGSEDDGWWSFSRFVWIDDNSDGQIDADEVINEKASRVDGLKIEAANPSPAPDALTFDPKGLLDTRFASFTFAYAGGANRCLSVSLSGSASVLEGVCP